MTRQALIVTGARALAESPHADTWSRAMLQPRISALPSDAIVIAGDASGPDDWATAIASARGLLVTVYDKHGWRTAWRATRGRTVIVVDKRRWIEGLAPETREEWKTRLLRRNLVMVQDVASAHHAKKLEARVVALFAPWSRTQGAPYTAHQARSAGLQVEPLVCPDGYAPQTEAP